MALEQTQTVKGITINNAYLKIRNLATQATKPNRQVPNGPATLFTGTISLGVWANKTLADAGDANLISTISIQVADWTKIAVSGNVLASVYTYLKTLPAYSTAVTA